TVAARVVAINVISGSIEDVNLSVRARHAPTPTAGRQQRLAGPEVGNRVVSLYCADGTARGTATWVATDGIKLAVQFRGAKLVARRRHVREICPRVGHRVVSLQS